MQLQSVFKCWSTIDSLVLRAALISSVPCLAWAGYRPPPRAHYSARCPPLVIRMPTLGPSSTHAVDARTSSGSHFFKDFTTVSCNAMDTNFWKKVSCERCERAQMWRTPGISDSAEWWDKTEENLIIIEKSLKLYSQKRPGDATVSYNCLPTPHRFSIVNCHWLHLRRGGQSMCCVWFLQVNPVFITTSRTQL